MRECQLDVGISGLMPTTRSRADSGSPARSPPGPCLSSGVDFPEHDRNAAASPEAFVSGVLLGRSLGTSRSRLGEG
jgi:hypothetical protein